MSTPADTFQAHLLNVGVKYASRYKYDDPGAFSARFCCSSTANSHPIRSPDNIERTGRATLRHGRAFQEAHPGVHATVSAWHVGTPTTGPVLSPSMSCPPEHGHD